MAKSLRSKWRRKMRAVKRERNGEREMKRLNEMLIKAGDIQFQPEIKEEKIEETVAMAVDTEVGQSEETRAGRGVVRRSRLEKAQDQVISKSENTVAAEEVDLTVVTEEKMAVDGERIFRRKTMRDQFGQYPDWMNKRKIKTQQKKNKRLKKRAKSLKRK